MAPRSASRPTFLTDPALTLLVFGGKGGVGKTTSAAAAAIRIARDRPGARILLASTDPAHSVADALAQDAPGAEALPPNLRVAEIDAQAEHAAFMRDHGSTLAEIAARGTFLDKDDVDQMLTLSIPGVDELMSFLRLASWVERGEHDLIVVDTAPTGHALRLLELTGVMEQWLEAMDALLAKHRYMASLFARGAKKAADRCEEFLDAHAQRFENLGQLLRDGARCRFVPVMLAEPMSVAETEDLLRELGTLGVHAPEIIINRLIPTTADGGPLGMIRREQAGAVRALPPSIARCRLWGLTLRAEEPRGAGALATIYDEVLDADSLAAWSACPPHVASEIPRPTIAGSALLPAWSGEKDGTGLLVVAGKGGVGKTTMASAAACALAQRVRTLVVSTDPAHSLADCVGVPLGDAPSPLTDSLWAMELNAHRELEQLKKAYAEELEEFLESFLGGLDVTFDREVLERLMDLAPPGLDEVMALVRVVELIDGSGGPATPASSLHLTLPTGASPPRFGAIVLDTAPTGHALRLLEMPGLIEQWLSGIFRVLLKHRSAFKLPKLERRLVELSRGVKKLRAMLADGRSCVVLPVTIPTQLALAETRDLVDRCVRMGLTIRGSVVNLVTPKDWSERDPLARAVVAREAPVLESYRGVLPGGFATVQRGRQPRGLEELTALAGGVFHMEASGGRQAA